jgi:hypothetical protein
MLDPSFQEVVAQAVHNAAKKLAPKEPVREIGQVPPQIFHFVATAPADKEIRWRKVDLSDWFWRLVVLPEQKWNFCCMMPDPPGSRVQIVAPSALQMSWAESPTCFCAAAETGRDIIDLLLRERIELLEHPLQKFMAPTEPPKTAPQGQEQASVSVCVDDFVLGPVENDDRTLFRRASRAAPQAVHSVFLPPEASGHSCGEDPASLNKLQKGDAQH